MNIVHLLNGIKCCYLFNVIGKGVLPNIVHKLPSGLYCRLLIHLYPVYERCFSKTQNAAD
jgi:hypothetical protein